MSVRTEDWIDTDEREVICAMVGRALATGDDADVGQLAPAARLRLLVGDPVPALRGVEAAVVAYRRRLAGGLLAAATGEDPATVASRYALGHCSTAEDGRRWRAAGRID
jgi:hypothetical protein